jgi:hypothetical protein
LKSLDVIKVQYFSVAAHWAWVFYCSPTQVSCSHVQWWGKNCNSRWNFILPGLPLVGSRLVPEACCCLWFLQLQGAVNKFPDWWLKTQKGLP